jgi:hypothetical protein
MSEEIKVRSDPGLTTEEKETLIGFSNADDRLRIHSEQASIVKWLIGHPEYQEDSRREKDGTVYATTGTLPVGVLKLKVNARQSSMPSDVIGKVVDNA